MKLVIYLTMPNRRDLKHLERPIEIPNTDLPDWAQDVLEYYGREWAEILPDDIVMLVGADYE